MDSLTEISNSLDQESAIYITLKHDLLQSQDLETTYNDTQNYINSLTDNPSSFSDECRDQCISIFSLIFPVPSGYKVVLKIDGLNATFTTTPLPGVTQSPDSDDIISNLANSTISDDGLSTSNKRISNSHVSPTKGAATRKKRSVEHEEEKEEDEDGEGMEEEEGNGMLPMLLDRIDSYRVYNDNKLARKIEHIESLSESLSSYPTVQSPGQSPAWAGNGSIHSALSGNFDTNKKSLVDALNDMDERVKLGGMPYVQDDSLEHQYNIAVHNHNMKSIKGYYSSSIHKHQPESFASMLHPRDNYGNASSVNYILGYENDGYPKSGDAGNIGTRESFLANLPENKRHSHIAIFGSSNEIIASGYAHQDLINDVYNIQTISEGYDTGAKAERLSKEKIARQISECNNAIGYNSQPGPILEQTLAIPSMNMRQLTNGKMMLFSLEGDVGKKLVKCLPSRLQFSITYDTWPKIDDVARKIDVLSSLIHQKDKSGGVNPYLDGLIHNNVSYLGFHDMNECPFITAMDAVVANVNSILSRVDSSSSVSEDSLSSVSQDSSLSTIVDSPFRTQIMKVFCDFPHAKEPYVTPPPEVYAREAIAQLEAISKNGDIDADAAIINTRFSNIDNIQNSTIPEIQEWSNARLENLYEIPGGQVAGIKARPMRLVRFDKKYTLFVRGSSFCMFDGQQSLKVALRFCLEFCNEAVVKYSIGLINAEKLDQVLTMMKSYAMLIAGVSGSVNDPKGDKYSPINYVLPQGVVGASSGGSGNRIAGAMEIEAAFGDKLHYYGIVWLLHELRMESFNQLLKVLESDLKVVLLYDDVSHCYKYVFVDSKGKFLDQQYDSIVAAGRVKDSYDKYLSILTDGMITFLLNENADPTSDDMKSLMISHLQSLVTTLFEDCDNTNNKLRSMNRRQEMIIEYIMEKNDTNPNHNSLIRIVQGLPHLDSMGSTTLEWFNRLARLKKYKEENPLNDTGYVWVIIKSQCKVNEELIYHWWMKHHKESVGMAKRLLECIGISCDDDRVSTSLQHYQRKIARSALTSQQEDAKKALRSGYNNRFS